MAQERRKYLRLTPFPIMWTETVALTNTNGSKLWGNQGTAAELAVGRNWSPVEEAIGASRLEWGRGGGSGSRGG